MTWIAPPSFCSVSSAWRKCPIPVLAEQDPWSNHRPHANNPYQGQLLLLAPASGACPDDTLSRDTGITVHEHVHQSITVWFGPRIIGLPDPPSLMVRSARSVIGRWLFEPKCCVPQPMLCMSSNTIVVSYLRVSSSGSAERRCRSIVYKGMPVRTVKFRFLELTSVKESSHKCTSPMYPSQRSTQRFMIYMSRPIIVSTNKPRGPMNELQAQIDHITKTGVSFHVHHCDTSN